MRKVLAKVEDGRFGRAVAGLVTGSLVVEHVVRNKKEVIADVRSVGKNGTKVYAVCIRKRQVFCSCRDYRKRSVHCKHVAAVALHELGAAALARSERRDPAGVLLQLYSCSIFFGRPQRGF